MQCSDILLLAATTAPVRPPTSVNVLTLFACLSAYAFAQFLFHDSQRALGATLNQRENDGARWVSLGSVALLLAGALCRLVEFSMTSRDATDGMNDFQVFAALALYLIAPVLLAALLPALAAAFCYSRLQQLGQTTGTYLIAPRAGLTASTVIAVINFVGSVCSIWSVIH